MQILTKEEKIERLEASLKEQKEIRKEANRRINVIKETIERIKNHE